MNAQSIEYDLVSAFVSPVCCRSRPGEISVRNGCFAPNAVDADLQFFDTGDSADITPQRILKNAISREFHCLAVGAYVGSSEIRIKLTRSIAFDSPAISLAPFPQQDGTAAGNEA